MGGWRRRGAVLGGGIVVCGDVELSLSGGGGGGGVRAAGGCCGQRYASFRELWAHGEDGGSRGIHGGLWEGWKANGEELRLLKSSCRVEVAEVELHADAYRRLSSGWAVMWT